MTKDSNKACFSGFDGIILYKTRQDKTRQDKTRQDKTRQDKTRQDRFFSFFKDIQNISRAFIKGRFIIFFKE